MRWNRKETPSTKITINIVHVYKFINCYSSTFGLFFCQILHSSLNISLEWQHRITVNVSIPVCVICIRNRMRCLLLYLNSKRRKFRGICKTKIVKMFTQFIQNWLDFRKRQLKIDKARPTMRWEWERERIFSHFFLLLRQKKSRNRLVTGKLW